MATRNFLVAVAVLAIILAVNMTPVVGYVGNFKIINDPSVSNPVKVTCIAGGNTYGPMGIFPGSFWNNNFQIYPGTTGWKCDFEWDKLTGPVTQSFEVWSHLGGALPYLAACWEACTWTIKPDGFYWLGSDGSITREYEWLS